MESKATARFARIAPRKARTVVNLVRGRKVAEAIDMLLFTRKSAAPIVRKVIESALANAKQANPDVKVDELWVSVGMVDKGPNQHLRRWRPRAMGRATQIAKGVSHIAITLSDVAPPASIKPAYTKPERLKSGAPTATSVPAETSTSETVATTDAPTQE